MKNWMLAQNWWDEEQETVLFEDLRKKILAAVKVAEVIAKPAIEELITDVYDVAPAQLEQQLSALKEHIKKYPDAYPVTAGRIK
jgi:2-oxoisovalerate dehydrogenase E1 component alpha subunit